jgi:hypothetical protein
MSSVAINSTEACEKLSNTFSHVVMGVVKAARRYDLGEEATEHLCDVVIKRYVASSPEIQSLIKSACKEIALFKNAPGNN